MNLKSRERANSLPSSHFITRRSSMSLLFPTSNTLIPGIQCRLTSETQLDTFRNPSLSVISYTITIPYAPLQYVEVIVLKRSCPAVSQTYILINLLSISTVFILKSTPIVGVKFSVNVLSAYRMSNEDLPTPESPIRRILNKQSQSYVLIFIG